MLSGSRPSTVAQIMPLAACPARFRYSGTEGPYCWYTSVLVAPATQDCAILASSAGEKSLEKSTLGAACLTLESTGPQSAMLPSGTPSLVTTVQPSSLILLSKPLPITVP